MSWPGASGPSQGMSGLSWASVGIGAILLGLGMLAVAVAYAWRPTDQSARRLFLASITYLPLLWILMAVGRK